MCSCKTVFLKSTAICPIEDGFIYWRTHEFCWKSFQSSTSLSKQAASDKCANEGAELAIFTKEVFTSTWNYHAHYNQMSEGFYWIEAMPTGSDDCIVVSRDGPETRSTTIVSQEKQNGYICSIVIS
ncbi:hypothetical protein ScPMuIL_012276 [Solemya velum]